MYDEAIYFSEFCSATEKDEYDDPVQEEIRSEAVFARKKSIGQSEFYQAQTAGLKPELKFVIADHLDYNGQTYLIHDDMRYKILKTYQNEENELEITCYGGVRDVSATVSDED